MAATEEQITIITEDIDAEAAAEAAINDDDVQADSVDATAASALEEATAVPHFSDRSQRTASQQHALPPQQERPRQSLAQQADSGSGGRKSSVRMSTQLLLPRQRRAGGTSGGGGGGGAGSGRPSSPKLDNYLDEVPQPSRPRFSSSMSLEAQFAMMKSYESRLRSKILASNPEFANVLHVSPDLPAGLKRPNVSLKQRPATSREPPLAASSSAAAAAAAAAASTSHRRKTQRSQSLAPERSQISEETQLDLARRLQYAQYLSDYFVIKQGEPCLNYGLLRDKKDFNPIKKFNWWSSWWSRDFQFQEEGTAEERAEAGERQSHEA